MPELPEVETMLRGIAGCVGLRIAAVEKHRCRLKSIAIEPRIDRFRRRVVGCRITGTSRAGKRVLVHLENVQVIVFEPRMTGLVLVADPPNQSHLRLTFRLRSRKPKALSNGVPQALSFWDRRGLGSVKLFAQDELDHHFAKLGRDALEISANQLRSVLSKSRREIKVALLDQSAVAGIGNLYASEILHAAGIHPRRRCHRLTRDDWRRIHQAINRVLTAAISYEGSTLSDGTYRNALNKEGGYQNQHRVYDKAGEPCSNCVKTQVQRIVQAQRSTFFCRSCQPMRRRSSR